MDIGKLDSYIACEEEMEILKHFYAESDYEKILKAGDEILKQDIDSSKLQDVFSVFLLYFCSAKSKLKNPIDLRFVRKKYSEKKAEILRDLIIEKETEETLPILIVTQNSLFLQSFLKKGRIR